MILANPRYTGCQVWNRQHKHENLLDIEDVILGYTTTLCWSSKDKWLVSQPPAPAPDSPTEPNEPGTSTSCEVRERVFNRELRMFGEAGRTWNGYNLVSP